jgi:hypothetical protein
MTSIWDCTQNLQCRRPGPLGQIDFVASCRCTAWLYVFLLCKIPIGNDGTQNPGFCCIYQRERECQSWSISNKGPRDLPKTTFVAEIDKGAAFIVEDLAGWEGPVKGFAHTSVRGFITGLTWSFHTRRAARGCMAYRRRRRRLAGLVVGGGGDRSWW